jgi:outer membrane protein assembly factor BamB
MARFWAIFLVCAVAACKPRTDTGVPPEVWTFPTEGLVLTQDAPGVITARDAANGTTRWTYRHEPPTLAPYGERPPEEVVCPIVGAPLGFALFRFHEQLHAVDLVDGRRRWFIKLKTYRFCPAVTPDSGVVMVANWGEALEKLDQNGKRVWLLDLAPWGVAASPPTVAGPSGDVVLRTTRRLIGVSPSGAANWQVELDADLQESR